MEVTVVVRPAASCTDVTGETSVVMPTRSPAEHAHFNFCGIPRGFGKV